MVGSIGALSVIPLLVRGLVWVSKWWNVFLGEVGDL